MAMTIETLEAAFNGGSNARARYLLFAAKAEEEGYAQLASLFRAAASSEAIQAENHAQVIRAMGAEPRANLDEVRVGSTAENLKAAIDGQTRERDVVYPEFIRDAEAEGSQAAMVTFRHALAAKAEHARMHAEAAGTLEAWKGERRDFWICAACGYMLDKAPGDRCSACGSSRESFRVVN
jgi:rubrerythrin